MAGVIRMQVVAAIEGCDEMFGVSRITHGCIEVHDGIECVSIAYPVESHHRRIGIAKRFRGNVDSYNF